MTIKYLDEQNNKVWVEIRSKRVYRLFCEVWEALPPSSKALALQRISQITDVNSSAGVAQDKSGRTIFRAKANQIQLFSRRLHKHENNFIKYVIAHEIAHAIYHDKQRVEDTEDFSDTVAREWGYPRPESLNVKKQKTSRK